PTLSAQDQMDEATYVFSASVYDLRTDKKLHHRTIVFSVDSTFKGDPGLQVEALDADAGTDCETDFKEGDTYKVFARWDWGNVLVSSCTGTTHVDPMAQIHGLGPDDEER